MTRVLHVLDSDCHETHGQVLEMLRARLGGSGEHIVAATDAAIADRMSPHINTPIHLTPRRFLAPLNLAPSLGELIRNERVDLVHAWGVRAAAAACSVAGEQPIVLTMLEPAAAKDTARFLRSINRPIPVVTGTQRAMRLLATAGADAEAMAVIRGPADFGAINRAKKEGVREQLVGDAGPVIVVHGPAVRGQGHFEGVWACAIIRQICPDMRVILPYASAERGRIRRFAIRMTHDAFPVIPDSHLSWAELLSAADLFLAPAIGDICTEPIGMAMAAGVVCVGSAVHSTAEIIADRHNGLLSRDTSVKSLPARILAAIEDKALVRQVTDVARSQAFEVFGVRAFADNYERAYQNVQNGKPVGEGVVDTAMVS